jgi:septal ring factor EnvC (AmiA/AmiB activator)
MKALTMAALLIQLSAAGGAGGEGGRSGKRQASTGAAREGDMGKEFSSLKGEISSLKEQFRVAREKQRVEAERKKREEDARYAEPAKAPAPATPEAPAH